MNIKRIKIDFDFIFSLFENRLFIVHLHYFMNTEDREKRPAADIPHSWDDGSLLFTKYSASQKFKIKCA